jgi:ankyrin repeat protein
MRNRSLPASFAVALVLAAPPLAQAQSMLNFGGGGSRNPGAAAAPSGPAAAKIPPPPALPGAASSGTPAPINRAPVDMQPNDALFDAINRGDIATARDAISRGADLQGQNILGMTPLELSIDLGRNDISFLLLSMRGDNGRRPPTSATAATEKPQPAKSGKTRQAAPAVAKAATPSQPAAPQNPRLFSGDGGAPNPNAGFLGFDSARR